GGDPEGRSISPPRALRAWGVPHRPEAPAGVVDGGLARAHPAGGPAGVLGPTAAANRARLRDRTCLFPYYTRYLRARKRPPSAIPHRGPAPGLKAATAEGTRMPAPTPVLTGLDVLARARYAPLAGLAVGLVTHPAAVDRRPRHAAALLAGAPGVRLARLFGPEHGLGGEAQDLEGVANCRDPHTGLEVISLYGETADSLRPRAEQL